MGRLLNPDSFNALCNEWRGTFEDFRIEVLSAQTADAVGGGRVLARITMHLGYLAQEDLFEVKISEAA